MNMDMSMETGKWTHGHGHIDMDTWLWRHGNGHVEIDKWKLTHGNRHMNMDTWKWTLELGQGHKYTWTRILGHGHMDPRHMDMDMELLFHLFCYEMFRLVTI
jgi:hypothetical protein